MIIQISFQLDGSHAGNVFVTTSSEQDKLKTSRECELQGHCQCGETSLGLPHGVWKQTVSVCNSCSYFRKARLGKIDFKYFL